MPVQPVFISLAPDISQFSLYANGGWDGNWYVGYNTCWIVKLPPVPKNDYERIYIGAKLGRAKTLPVPERPWDKIPRDGKVLLALSQKPGFSSQQSYFLVENKDIPLESSPKESLSGTGSAQWFWTEVPVRNFSYDGPNYLALWSSAEDFTAAENSPIVAGAEVKGLKETSVWLNRSIIGAPPRDGDSSMEIPVNGLVPAIAIKAIPKNTVRPSVSPLKGKTNGRSLILSFSATGQDIDSGWVEISFDRFDWQRITKYSFQPPYSFVMDKSQLPENDACFLRGATMDMAGNVGYSKEITIRPKR